MDSSHLVENVFSYRNENMIEIENRTAPEEEKFIFNSERKNNTDISG